MSEYIHIGKLVASFGLKGELILKHELGKKSAFKGIEVIFVEEQKGNYLPYFIELAKAANNDETYVKFEGINTKESTARLISKNAWVTDTDFRSLVGKTAPIAMLGYMLVNQGAILAPIEEVINQPHQVLLRITLKEKEVLIPLHEASLDKIDHAQKQVHVILPDGLLEIYTD
ncbi:MAG: 16S rRNA processing protein RimM [Bacteroidota bacterium]